MTIDMIALAKEAMGIDTEYPILPLINEKDFLKIADRLEAEIRKEYEGDLLTWKTTAENYCEMYAERKNEITTLTAQNAKLMEAASPIAGLCFYAPGGWRNCKMPSVAQMFALCEAVKEALTQPEKEGKE